MLSAILRGEFSFHLARDGVEIFGERCQWNDLRFDNRESDV